MQRWVKAISGILLLAVGGCDIVLEDSGSDKPKSTFRSTSDTITTDSTGFATVTVDVHKAEDGVLISFESTLDTRTVYVDSVVDPNGRTVFKASELWQSSISTYNAVFPASVVSVNLPSLDTDGPLVSGAYKVEFATVDASYRYKGGVPVNIYTHYKDDDKAREGDLVINLVYTGATAQDEALAVAVETAKSIWRDMYGAIGVTVTFEEYDLQANVSGFPGYSDATGYAAVANETEMRAVNMVFVQNSGMNGLYGISGGIPGPLEATDASAVLVDVHTNAGSDGRFNDDEVRLLAETMAHEAGHFVGMFHPVESNYKQWDPVSDTPQCNSRSACDRDLGGNLMYPYPICDWGGTCQPQSVLTSGQGVMVNHYAGVK